MTKDQKQIDPSVALQFFAAQNEWLKNYALIKAQEAHEAQQALVALMKTSENPKDS